MPLYSFKDAKRAAAEDAGCAKNAERKRDFNPAEYARKKDAFGVIVFESGLDLPAKAICLCCDDRWLRSSRSKDAKMMNAPTRPMCRETSR
jgi:hypothetical protein